MPSFIDKPFAKVLFPFVEKPRYNGKSYSMTKMVQKVESFLALFVCFVGLMIKLFVTRVGTPKSVSQ